MKPATREDYERRLARVVAAIEADPAAEHSVESLAALAHFSPYHFHRIYRAMRGETLFETIRRARIRRAAHELAITGRPVLDIALGAGFESAQSFARAFKAMVSVSPTAFRRGPETFADYVCGAPSPVWEEEEMKVDIVEQKPLTLHALRYEGPVDEIPVVWRDLWRRIVERGLAAKIELAVGAAHDAPDPQGRIVYWAGVVLRAPTPLTDGLEIKQIPGGLYGSYRLIGPYSGIGEAFPHLFGEWLPASGYEVDHRPALEIYRNNPYDTPEAELITDLLVPIRAAR
jgi:AraC family transcriptional regulator